ncbi:MAG: bifunctional DNA-formamidopyrimidine glycosylase/DNA-(apurinic or apyrimidinic site) lyase [Proteobacteria bacterium]|nr:bifunctional DNA-formamidopyrimidine glycosylase/DNA-(apurinic or apyrimidinic site) lyase [Pseudomonadota bacterium]MBU1714912.1 bifunctional DNA-formamidopyrimidine glycosylase/DNA-(apurinic or apyrimidinic site) lyase [Pseudomonadota bacterium]
MPELPEVEVICRGLAPNLIGCRILATSFSNKKLRLPVPQKLISEKINGHRILQVERRAKFIMITMDSAFILVIHLGMTGRLGFFAPATTPARHDHVRWRLDNNMELRFNDTRRFGSVQVFKETEINDTDLFTSLGPDPFWDSFSASYLMEKSRKRTSPIKNFLMDNRIVVGIGNIYASEILFNVRIHPVTPAQKLDRSQWEMIVQGSREILSKAIAEGGTTIADYVNSSGEKGYFQHKLKVYGKNGNPCSICRTPISRQVMAGRATFFCGKCQK